LVQGYTVKGQVWNIVLWSSNINSWNDCHIN